MSEPGLGDPNVGRLYSVARALTGALTAGQVAEAVFTHAVAELGAVSVGLWLVEAGRVRFVGGAGLHEELPDRVFDFSLDAPMPAAEVVGERRIVVYRSAEERDRRWPDLAGIPSATQAAVVAPLEVHDRLLGCLHIGFATASEAGHFDLAFFSSLAELCAAGLDRAQLHDAEQARQAFLLDASAAVAGADGSAQALRELATVAVPRLADLCLIDVREEGGRIRRVAAVHADPAVADLVAELERRYPPEPGGSHPASVALASRSSSWAGEMTEEFLRATTVDDRHFDLVRRLRFESYMCVPLMAANQALGVMTLVSAGSGRRFDGSDLSLAQDLASRAAGVVALARRREREHELAHVLQALLLPDPLPVIDGLEISVRYLTAHSEAEAGGDFYDLVELPSGRLGLVVGDVEGHDAVAAATMGQLRAATRALAGQYREPAQVVDALRWSWDLLGFSRMATAVFGRIDPAAGDVVLSSAGHLPPVLVTAEGRAALTPMDNTPPLGAPSRPAVDQRFSMAPGDTLFFYTDGLVEERRGSIDRHLDGLLSTLEGSAGVPVKDLCDMVVGRHAPDPDRTDDVAVMAVRRSG